MTKRKFPEWNTEADPLKNDLCVAISSVPEIIFILCTLVAGSLRMMSGSMILIGTMKASRKQPKTSTAVYRPLMIFFCLHLVYRFLCLLKSKRYARSSTSYTCFYPIWPIFGSVISKETNIRDHHKKYEDGGSAGDTTGAGYQLSIVKGAPVLPSVFPLSTPFCAGLLCFKYASTGSNSNFGLVSHEKRTCIRLPLNCAVQWSQWHGAVKPNR